MRKFFALAAALGMIFGAMAIRPAAANEPLPADHVAAAVQGGVNVDAGPPGPLDCYVDNVDDPDTEGPDFDGSLSQFIGVNINGTFTADTVGLADFTGEVFVGDVTVCVRDDLVLGGVLPAFSHGIFVASELPNDFATAVVPGVGVGSAGAVCLVGELLGGSFENNGVVTSTAVIDAHWEIFRATGPASAPTCTTLGQSLGESAAAVPLRADVLVAPAGAVGENFGVPAPDVVSAQIQSMETNPTPVNPA